MIEIVRWYAVVAVIGMGALLPVQLAFGRLQSGGLLVARPMGLLLVAGGAWIASAAFRIEYGTPLALAMVVALYAWSGILAWTQPSLWHGVRSRVGVLLGCEALYLALFAVVLFIATRAPAAILNEQPFDLLLLNAIRNTSHMPVGDPWLAGYHLAYYYLGQTMVDVAGRLASLDPWVEYHLGFAMAGAAAGVAVFALAIDAVALARPSRRRTQWTAGGLAVLLLLFVSAAVTIVDLLSANGIGRDLVSRLGVEWLPDAAGVATGVPVSRYWWTRESAVIPGAITEFPALTLLYGNLHAHWLALAYAPIALSLALLAFIDPAPTWRRWVDQPGSLVLAAALFAGIAMMNTWDTVVYGLVWAGAALLANARTSTASDMGRTMLRAAGYLAVPAVVALLLAFPYLQTMHTPLTLALLTDRTSSPYSGQGWTDPIRFSLVWATLLLPVVTGLAMIRVDTSRRIALTGIALGIALLGAWALAAIVTGAGSSILDRGSNWLTLTFAVLALGWTASAMWTARASGNLAVAIATGLIAAASAIFLLTEVAYIGDGMGGRANTVFKFWYAIWLMLSVAAAVLIALAFDRPRGRLRLATTAPLILATIIVTGGSLLYLPAGVASKIREPQDAGLDALAFLDSRDADVAESMRWIRANVPNDSVVLEAASGPDLFQNWTSVATGRPTLLGWLQHEEIWRGRDPELYRRYTTIAAFYRRGATAENLELARQLGIDYVRIGREEERLYSDGQQRIAERFVGWPAPFIRGAVRVIKVPR